MSEGTWIQCKKCKGTGETLHEFFVEYPEIFRGEGVLENIPCTICGGTGKVKLSDESAD